MGLKDYSGTDQVYKKLQLAVLSGEEEYQMFQADDYYRRDYVPQKYDLPKAPPKPLRVNRAATRVLNPQAREFQPTMNPPAAQSDMSSEALGSTHVDERDSVPTLRCDVDESRAGDLVGADRVVTLLTSGPVSSTAESSLIDQLPTNTSSSSSGMLNPRAKPFVPSFS